VISVDKPIKFPVREGREGNKECKGDELVYTAEHVKGGTGKGGRVRDAGNLNLKNAINMETTEQRFTQIRAERRKNAVKAGEKDGEGDE